MEYIYRHIEDIVRKTDSTFKGVLLTGARQTGKSTLLQELFPDKRYVAIDDPFIEAQANENPNEFMMLNPPPVIYDENGLPVQYDENGNIIPRDVPPPETTADPE